MNAILCGLGYGRRILKWANSDLLNFNVVLLHSKGSKKSIDFAKELNIEFVEKLDKKTLENIQVAFLAVPKKVANRLVPYFLNNGIHVYSELPISVSSIKNGIDKIENTDYPNLFLNFHFSYFKASRKFIDCIHDELKVDNFPRIMVVTCGSRALYYAINTVFESLKSINYKIVNSSFLEGYTTFHLKIDQTKLIFNVYTKTSAIDDARDTPLIYNIKTLFKDKSINLLNPYGPLLTSSSLRENGYGQDFELTKMFQDDVMMSDLRKSRELATFLSLKTFNEGIYNKESRQSIHWLYQIASLYESLSHSS